MVLVRASRPLGLLLALTLIASGAAKGWCFMPGMRGAGPRGAHECCKTGWVAAQPACCLESQAKEAPATAGARHAANAPPVAVAPAFPETPPYVPLQVCPRSPEDCHSPPGNLVLRV